MNPESNDEPEGINPQLIEYQKLVTHYTSQIDKHAINTMPDYEEHGREIVVVDDDKNIQNAVDELMKSRYLGFDTESRPTFKKGQKSHGISIIQISSTTCCYIFQMRHLTRPELLTKIIDNPQLIKIGVGLKDDLSKLRSSFNFHPAAFIDLAPIFKPLGRENDAGSKQLVALTLKQRLRKSKRASTSNWAVEKLSPTQIQYASDDAFSSVDVYLRLREQFEPYSNLLDKEIVTLLDH